MENTALSTLQSFHQSLGSGTTDWKNLLAEDITFQGPVDTVKGKTDFIKLNEEFGAFIRGHEILQAIENGKTVATEIVCKLEAPSGKVIDLEIAEIYQIEEGKIKSIRIYYDAEEFRKEFGR